MRLVTLGAAVMAFALVACAPQTPPKQDAATASESTCPDDGPRLPVTGVCQGRVSPYFTVDAGVSIPEPREECMWIGTEVASPDPNEALLLMAARCGDVTSSLEFSAGARSASLTVKDSAVFGPSRAGQELVRIFTTEGVADPKAMIQDMARQSTTNKQEAAACTLRPVTAEEGLPKDAFVVDVTPAYKTAKGLGIGEGPDADYAVCGEWGYDGIAYWLFRGGYAFHVNNGQDLPDFDFGTLTVMRKTAEGGWGSVE